MVEDFETKKHGIFEEGSRAGLGWRYDILNVAVCGFRGGNLQFVEWRAGRFWRFFGGFCDFLWNLVNLRTNMHQKSDNRVLDISPELNLALIHNTYITHTHVDC